jgi:hypothetical protein
MKSNLIHIVLLGAYLGFGSSHADDRVDSLGKFQRDKDLYLAHFDSRTDVDDIHSVAGVATMLADDRFRDVKYHAVAGAYGTQKGPYVPANDLFDLAFGEHWSDAHADFDKAVDEVLSVALETLQAEGDVWIADAGQSDFSAALVRRIRESMPAADVKRRINIVQHSNWNEEVTTPEDLSFVKKATSYYKIPDGNVVGNGTPGFRSDTRINWQEHVGDARLTEIWKTAIAVANTYNGADGRYLNESVQEGGLDFSDVAETAWIFGFGDLADAKAFFREFSSPQGNLHPRPDHGSGRSAPAAALFGLYFSLQFASLR